MFLLARIGHFRFQNTDETVHDLEGFIARWGYLRPFVLHLLDLRLQGRRFHHLTQGTVPRLCFSTEMLSFFTQCLQFAIHLADKYGSGKTASFTLLTTKAVEEDVDCPGDFVFIGPF
jgi:hypothetical protein